MPDKKREEFVTNLFLGHYNSSTGKQYEIVCSPEDDNKVIGTYDFLCKNKNSKDDYIAIEEKSLNKSTENVRDSVEIAEIVTEVDRILNERGFFYNKEHLFYLEFKNAPKSKERAKYAEKIAKLVEEVTSQNKEANIPKRLRLKIDGYDLIKEFSLLETRETPRVFFGFAPASNVSWDVQKDAFNATCGILQNGNAKLEIPRQEGKKTILIITNRFLIVNARHVREALQCMEDESHRNIDEIFFINKRSFKPGYDIDKIK